MADTPEKRIKRIVTNQLKALKDCYYFYPVTGGYGASGVPDIVGCYHGHFFAFECKAGKNKPTELQNLNMGKIRAAGGAVLVVNEHNALFVTDYLNGLLEKEVSNGEVG